MTLSAWIPPVASLDGGGFGFSSLGLGVGLADALMLLVAIGYTIFIVRLWLARKQGKRADPSIGASAVGTFVATSATGAAVLMAATGVVLGLGGDHPLPDQAFTQLTLTAMWLATSLVSGALCTSYALTYIHRPMSVAERPIVIGAATAQLVSLVFGGIFFVMSLFML